MKRYFLLFIPLLFIVSCKKSSSNNTSTTCVLSATSLIGNYKVTAVQYTYLGVSGNLFTSPFASYYPVCRRDDITSLDAGGVYVYTDADSTCTPNGSTTGTWSLKSDTLIISAPSQNDSVVISSFNCSTAIMNYNNFAGTGASLQVTFTRQ